MKKYSKNLIPEAETQIVGRRPSTVTPIFYLMQSVWNVIICVHQWPQWTYPIRAENNLLQMFTFCKVNVCLSSCQLSQAKPWRDHQSIAGLTQRDRPVLALVHTSEPVRFFFRFTCYLNIHVFGVNKEARVPCDTACRHRENMQPSHGKAPAGSYCEVMVLIT